FKLNGLTSEIVNRLSGIKDISIYFATSRKYIYNNVARIKPELTILGNREEVDEQFVTELLKKNPFLKIYRLENNSYNISDLNLIDQRSRKSVKFNHIIEENRRN
ncbi:MAG: hypothetical protein KAW88_05695, partial [Candidatus Cloacimonetes bacterium]|nr:hypothetical protein [Candidatus Cloacimonadota bacterium]